MYTNPGNFERKVEWHLKAKGRLRVCRRQAPVQQNGTCESWPAGAHRARPRSGPHSWPRQLRRVAGAFSAAPGIWRTAAQRLVCLGTVSLRPPLAADSTSALLHSDTRPEPLVAPQILLAGGGSGSEGPAAPG